MSRSQRKTPIFGHTTSGSEAQDKRLWHKRWRTRERIQLHSLSLQSDPLPIHRNEVSSTWEMAKDGKSWFCPRSQVKIAARLASKRTHDPKEHTKITRRLLARWRSK